ncbi:hypothetical protein EDF88_2971 [Buttiauxella sp. BIGb0552]|nr:hypothetical protein EDF88_2971 [Buttiauxella sp. BIGb0552]
MTYKNWQYFYAGYQASKVYNSATKSDAMNDSYLNITIENQKILLRNFF